ncbi:Auxin-induced protein 5NG4 [Hordeum vulgare]|nr:Auxin-induced protein 5NG4 [Hordeum vulgare]
MEFHGPTFQAPGTRPERMYPAGVVVENQLRVWAMSRWRGGREFAGLFLRALYRHLPVETPQMFTINESRMGGTGMIVRFHNPYDAYHLLGRVCSSVSSDSKYLAIGTTLPTPLSELPQFSICGTPPKLSSQVAATLESM